MARKYRVEIFYPLAAKEYPEQAIKELVEDLRPRDKLDLEAAAGSADFGIRQSIVFSDTVYFYYDDRGKCISILGLGQLEASSLGRSIWSVSTNEIEKGYVKSLLIKEAQYVVSMWALKHGLLQNVVNTENEKSIHYMEKILGAVFLPECICANGHAWRPFYILPKGGE